MEFLTCDGCEDEYIPSTLVSQARNVTEKVFRVKKKYSTFLYGKAVLR